MTDLAAQLRASNEAQAKVRDLLDAAQDILKHGNRLYNDVHDRDAWVDTIEANTRVVTALTAFIRIVRGHDAP
jgi:uncharacterized protein (DUF1778 family)